MSIRIILVLLLTGMNGDVGAGTQPLTYRDTGAGTTVLFIPGLSGCVHGWRNVVPLVEAAGCRAIVVEPLGVGSSPRPVDADYSLTAQADRFAALLDSLHAGPAVIVAHGISVSMALRMAVRRPDLIRAIVAIEGGPAENAASPTLAGAMGKANLAVKILGLGVVRGRFRSNLEASSGDSSWLDEETLRAYLAGPAADFGAARRAYHAMSMATEPDSLGPNLHRVDCRVTLLLGGAPHSGSLPEDQFDAMRKGLRRLVVESVPGAGHFLHEERPDLVAAEAIALSLAVAPAGGHLRLGVVAPRRGAGTGRQR